MNPTITTWILIAVLFLWGVSMIKERDEQKKQEGQKPFMPDNDIRSFSSLSKN